MELTKLRVRFDLLRKQIEASVSNNNNGIVQGGLEERLALLDSLKSRGCYVAIPASTNHPVQLYNFLQHKPNNTGGVDYIAAVSVLHVALVRDDRSLPRTDFPDAAYHAFVSRPETFKGKSLTLNGALMSSEVLCPRKITVANSSQIPYKWSRLITYYLEHVVKPNHAKLLRANTLSVSQPTSPPAVPPPKKRARKHQVMQQESAFEDHTAAASVQQPPSPLVQGDPLPVVTVHGGEEKPLALPTTSDAELMQVERETPQPTQTELVSLCNNSSNFTLGAILSSLDLHHQDGLHQLSEEQQSQVNLFPRFETVQALLTSFRTNQPAVAHYLETSADYQQLQALQKIVKTLQEKVGRSMILFLMQQEHALHPK